MKGRTTVQDAMRVAEHLVKLGQVRSASLASTLSWDAHRLNAACEYLAARNLMLVSLERPSHHFKFAELQASPATDQFIRDNKHS
jgi:hypothetical protein